MTRAVLRRCLGRMKAWVFLAQKVLDAEFPQCEAVQALEVFNVKGDAATPDMMQVPLRRLAARADICFGLHTTSRPVAGFPRSCTVSRRNQRVHKLAGVAGCSCRNKTAARNKCAPSPDGLGERASAVCCHQHL